jgi:transcriptional repressor NrdR
LVEEIEKEVKEKFYDEVSSGKIGEIVMRSLRKLDDIAYVRFASVYRQFTDVDDFLKEVKRFSHTKRGGG